MRTLLALTVLLASACTTIDRTTLTAAADSAAAAAGPAIVLAPAVEFPDTPFGREARRGLAILNATKDSLGDHVGNGLRCTSCHLDDGRRQYAMTWVGVTARYPQFRTRAAAVLTIEDRIHECIERSLAGRRLPAEDARVRAMLAYYALLSAGVPVGSRVPGQGVDSAHAGLPADATRGTVIYQTECARCHGADGAGTATGTPLWGNGAYTIAAGMARVGMAAAFIKHNMPFDRPGTLSDQAALDVAAYINSHGRPDYPGKENDWPKGGAPADVPFVLKSGTR